MADFSFVDGNAPSATTWNANVRDQLFVICTSSTRPTSPTTGRHLWETDTLKGYYYSGSTWVQIEDMTTYAAWTSFTPTWTTSGTAPAIGNGTLSGKYRLIGKTLEIEFTMLAGTTTTFGTGTWAFALPASKTVVNLGCISAGLAALASTWPVTVQGSSGTVLVYTPTSSTDPRLTAVTVTSPTAWATGHYVTAAWRGEVA